MGGRGNYAVSRDAQINHRLEECVEDIRQRLDKEETAAAGAGDMFSRSRCLIF
jgi:hypothetical protein